MLSGTLTPSSASIIQHPKILYEDEPKVVQNATSTTTQLPNTTTNTHHISERTRSDASGRSAALERAYVHDVYENCEEPVGPIRPRVAQFLAGLDAGSLVCDVGCGSGRYFNSCNPLIYSIGVDRCYRLTKIAKEKGGEVAVCDNLELPFRDESFDAVLSLAVIHHFATTERRVGAIRELARILRIGGRVIISVWALEQRHKRFESQDVLVPWQPPKVRNPNASDDEDDEDFLPPYHAYTEDSTNSSRSAGDGDSSSLSSSSPGESCYSFVRRAIQKLAGGKKHPWFLESWNSKETKHGSSLDYEDAKDLPIELRRLEDFDDLPEPPLSAGLKSRSLGSILNPPPRTMIRSRSSVPSLGAQIPESKPSMPTTESRRPKLVKQKQSFCDDVDFSLPELSNTVSRDSRILLRKQSSLNEELMAESRLREKERVRKRIQKQMSLNEAFLCRSIFTKRLQVIREGFTTKLKSSTGNIERVTKNGFVKIIQNIKGQQQNQYTCNSNNNNKNSDTIHNSCSNNSISVTSTSINICCKGCMKENEKEKTPLSNQNSNELDESKPRRHSRESGSDSSKDSSLQSDTSVESEDSFASVIYIPKPGAKNNDDSNSSNKNCEIPLSTNTKTPPVKMSSVPTSPLILPCPTPAHSPALPSCCKLQINVVEKETRFTFEEEKLQKADGKSLTIAPKKKVAPPSVQLLIKQKETKTTKGGAKITRQHIKDLPPIPKFRKAPSFPIVRRISAAPAVPKLMSLEIFNPETDDLDSDSSEPSSPDSVDSVINATLKSNKTETDFCELIPSVTTTQSIQNSTPTNSIKCVNMCSSNKVINTKDSSEDEVNNINKATIVNNSENDIIIKSDDSEVNNYQQNHQQLVNFAEELSAQLLKELDVTDNQAQEENSLDEDDDESYDCDDNDSISLIKTKDNSKYKNNSKKPKIDDPYVKKINGEIRELNNLREELRERRLMLANLSTSVNYNNNNSIKNVSTSQSDTIHEEDESVFLNDFYFSKNSCSCLYGTENNPNNLERNEFIYEKIDDHQNNDVDNNQLRSTNIDTALLIQEDTLDENVIVLDKRSSNFFNPINNYNTFNNNSKQCHQKHKSIHNKSNCVNNNTNNNKTITQQTSNDSHQSLESTWEHSNSTGSLDSPSVGGSATHHRYYHVFREGELDALINHHVASLHIVSSYYERASWCVVAEKVQVWTI